MWGREGEGMWGEERREEDRRGEKRRGKDRRGEERCPAMQDPISLSINVKLFPSTNTKLVVSYKEDSTQLIAPPPHTSNKHTCKDK